MERLILKPFCCCVVLISVLSCFHSGQDMDADTDILYKDEKHVIDIGATISV